MLFGQLKWSRANAPRGSHYSGGVIIWNLKSKSETLPEGDHYSGYFSHLALLTPWFTLGVTIWNLKSYFPCRKNCPLFCRFLLFGRLLSGRGGYERMKRLSTKQTKQYQQVKWLQTGIHKQQFWNYEGMRHLFYYPASFFALLIRSICLPFPFFPFWILNSVSHV